MKKIVFLIAVFLVISASSPVFALDYIVGAKGGYFGWSPFVKDVDVPMFENIETGTGALYGPIFSVIFSQDLSFSLTGLYGTQSAAWQVSNHFTDGRWETGTHYMDETRYDVDSALSYRLFGGFKIFLGFKYQFLDLDIVSTTREADDPDPVSIGDGTNNIQMHFMGPALGIGYSTTFAENFFFTLNVSVLYTSGEFEMEESHVKYEDPNYNTAIANDPFIVNSDIRQYGINIEPVIGINTGGGGPIITLGIRYQYMRTQLYNLPDEAGGDFPTNWLNDHLYGVFVGAMFML